jgi:hypothetical protein
MVGKVICYYPKIGIAAVILEDYPATGDRIHICGSYDDVHQSVTSIENEHIPIRETDRGQDIGITGKERVHGGDVVFRES